MKKYLDKILALLILFGVSYFVYQVYTFDPNPKIDPVEQVTIEQRLTKLEMENARLKKDIADMYDFFFNEVHKD